MILNKNIYKKIDINLPSNEYFPKSISIKAKNDQGKSYSDRTNRQRNRQRDLSCTNLEKLETYVYRATYIYGAELCTLFLWIILIQVL